MTIAACRRRHAPLALLMYSVAMAACSVPPEQPIVSDFFAASRLRDTTALARFATVVFEPREQGIVASFHIERVTPERTAGDRQVKDVVVLAGIRLPSGGVTDRRLTVTLEKRPKGEDPGAPYGGWMVTGVSAAGGPGAAPRS